MANHRFSGHSLANGAALAAYVLGLLIISISGKDLGESLFYGREPFPILQRDAIAYGLAAFLSAGLGLMHAARLHPYPTIIASVLIVGTSIAAIMTVGGRASPLILILILVICAAAVGSIVVGYFIRNSTGSLVPKAIVVGGMSSIRNGIIVFAASFAIVEFIARDKGERSDSFITTLAYPSVVLVGVIGLVVIWAMLPAALKLLDEQDANSSLPLDDEA